MNEYIIERHNSRVKPGDKTYFLGDVVMSHKWLYLLDRFNGEKVLIKGNHDTAKISQYVPYFKDIRGSHQMEGVIMTHIPIHPESLARWGVNIHGHLHSYRVKDQYGNLDKRYYNVSMECLKDYTPVSLEEIKSELDPKA
jgi:calcineurin-like phosphoesterase family protein